MTENYFNSLKKYLNNCTSDQEYGVIIDMDHLYSSIFLLCKKGELIEAENELKLADQKFNRFVKLTKIENHVNIVRLPIIAYLFFRQGHFDKAETLLQKSIDASCSLEKEKKSFLLKMYQVQQYHNYARILFKKEEYNDWGLEMKRVLDHSLSYSLTLNNEETLVYIGMVDQLIYEVIKFSDLIKEENHLQKLVKNLKFKHSLFTTNNTLRSINEWCRVKSNIYESKLNIINESNTIESILYDKTLKDLYKKSLIKSLAPYLNDEAFLGYLSIIKRENLAC